MTEPEDSQNDHDAPKELGALVQLERDELDRRPPEWEQVAAGKLTVDEASARIRERGAQTDEEIAEAAALFSPPDADFERELVDRLAGMKPAEAPAEVVPISAAKRWRLPLVAGVTAIAAAVLLWWAGSTGFDPVQPPGDRIAIAVPSHEIWIEKTAEVRGDATDEAPELHAGSTMTFFLRPHQAYGADPIVWACAERDGNRQPLSVAHELHGNVVEVKAELPADMQPGAWHLLAFVSHDQAPAAPCDAPQTETTRIERHNFTITP